MKYGVTASNFYSAAINIIMPISKFKPQVHDKCTVPCKKAVYKKEYSTAQIVNKVQYWISDA